MRWRRWTLGGLIAGLVLAGGAGAAVMADEKEKAPTDGTLELPRVGTVGALPPEATRVVVRVTRDAYIRVDGAAKPVGLEDLRRHLRKKSEGTAMRAPDGSSNVDVLFEIDAEVPWVLTQWLMQTCAHPEVRVHKIWFGAQIREGGAKGAIATKLPVDRGLPRPPAFPQDFCKTKLKVFKREGRGPASGMRPLYAAIKDQLAAARDLGPMHYEIVAPPPKGGAVPHGFVMQLIDVCLALGAKQIIFEGAAMPWEPGWGEPEPLKQHLAKVRGTPGVPQVRVNNATNYIGSETVAFPPVPAKGVVKGPWGATLTPMLTVVEEDLEETEEEPAEPPEEGFRRPDPPKEPPHPPPPDDDR